MEVHGISCNIGRREGVHPGFPETVRRLRPQNWITHHGSLSGQRFSSLSQINKGNVKNLKLPFTYAMGGMEGGGIWPHGGLEGTPIVEDGFMYITDGWGTIYKLDVREGSAKLVWKMNPKTEHDYPAAVTCCGVNNCGVGLWRDKVVSHTLDGRLIITDKKSGEITFQRQVSNGYRLCDRGPAWQG